MSRMRRITGWSVLACLGLTCTVLAFKPAEDSFGHTMITQGVLRKGYSFSGTSVPKFTTVLAVDGKTIEFSDEAAAQVVEGNQSTDWLRSHDSNFEGVTVHTEGEINREEAHCDNDLLVECGGRIVTKKQLAIQGATAYVASKDKKALVRARIHLGKALHTLQDFYAHSNWSDNRTSPQIYTGLTGSNVAADVLGRSVTTCTARVPGPAGGWEHNGGNYALTAQGKRPEKLTSGYFDNLRSLLNIGSASDSPVAKCDHGVEILNRQVSGINKDAPYSPFTPGPQSNSLWDRIVNMFTAFEQNSGESALHVRASHHAALHTHKFLEEVVADIRRENADAGRADEIVSALLGVEQTPVIGFVIDTTGSMGDIIAGVQQQVQLLIDSATGTSGASTRKFLVVDYGDPGVGASFIGNASEAKARVAGLVAGGGGDCPELTYGGLLAALSTAPRKSVLYVFTDASAKDASRASETREAARAKEVTVNFVASGSCSPVDPTYYDVATATGGLVLVTEHNSASVAAAFAGISIESEGLSLRPVHIEQGAIGTSKTVRVPVESGATTFTVQVASPDGTVEFFAPGGARVTGGPNTTVTDFLGGRSIKVKNPAVGEWSVVIRSTVATTYTLRADIAAPLDLSRVGFTRRTAEGRAGHEAHVPYSGEPPRTTVRLHATVAGNPRSATFQIVGVNGAVLASAAGTRVGPGAYAANVALPDVPFRIGLGGADASDRPYQRTMPTIYRTETLLIEAVDNPVWVPGADNVARFRVTNYGGTRAVAVTAAPTGATLLGVSPASAVLANGESAVFAATIAIPAGAPAGVENTLNVQAMAEADAATMLYPFTVGADTDGDGVPDMMERGRSGGDLTYDGNEDGTPDWRQANVASLFTRNANSYVTLVTDRGSFGAVAAVSAPQAAAASMGMDGFRATVRTGSAGATARVRMLLPDYVAATGFHSASAAGVWSDHAPGASDAVTVNGNAIVVSVVDGKRGDTDGAANGEIVLVGGPAGAAMAGVLAKAPPVPEEPEAEGGGGGGGGCTVGRPGTRDGSLVILALLAAIVLYRRRRAPAAPGGQSGQ